MTWSGSLPNMHYCNSRDSYIYNGGLLTLHVVSGRKLLGKTVWLIGAQIGVWIAITCFTKVQWSLQQSCPSHTRPFLCFFPYGNAKHQHLIPDDHHKCRQWPWTGAYARCNFTLTHSSGQSKCILHRCMYTSFLFCQCGIEDAGQECWCNMGFGHSWGTPHCLHEQGHQGEFIQVQQWKTQPPVWDKLLRTS